MRWMDTDPVIHGEVSQRDKNKYHILTYIYIYIYKETRKTVLMNSFAGQK